MRVIRKAFSRQIASPLYSVILRQFLSPPRFPPHQSVRIADADRSIQIVSLPLSRSFLPFTVNNHFIEEQALTPLLAMD